MHIRLSIIIILTCVMLAPATASAQLASFAGTWINVKKTDPGMESIGFSIHGTTILIKPHSMCMWGPCGWGIWNGRAYGPDVGSHLVSAARAITATQRDDFGVELLTIVCQGTGLVVTLYTHYTDHSKRTDDVSVEHFRRQQRQRRKR